MKDGRRVVVTGMGIVSPVGSGDVFWKNLVEGNSGIVDLSKAEDKRCAFLRDSSNDLGRNSKYRSCIGGMVQGFDKEMYVAREDRRKDPCAVYALGAAEMAMRDSGLDVGKLDPYRVGVIIGTGSGGMETVGRSIVTMHERGPHRVKPSTIPNFIANSVPGIVSMKYGFRGSNHAVVSACASAGHSIINCFKDIRHGYADVMIGGGTDAAICPIGFSGFGNMGALSARNDSPTEASRPFDKDRDGFVMSEGSVIFVLEEFEGARKRGANIHAEILGFGATGDAYSVSAPREDGSAAARAMTDAMNMAGISPSDVGYIHAHGTSTSLGDVAETKAVKLAFGSDSENVPISATKSITGHLLGAAGGTGLAAAIFAMKYGVVPPTINLDDIDMECRGLNHVANEAREVKDLAYCVSNAFAFWGQNSSIVVGRV